MEYLLSTKQVTEILGVSRQCVNSLVLRKRLKCYRFGKLYRYKIKDVEDYIKLRDEYNSKVLTK